MRFKSRKTRKKVDFEPEEIEATVGGGGWGRITTAAGLVKRVKGEPESAALIWRLRAETTMSLKWLAAEWHLGSWTQVSMLLGQKKYQ